MDIYRRIGEELEYIGVDYFMQRSPYEPNCIEIIIGDHLIECELDYYVVSSKLEKLGYRNFRFQIRPEHLFRIV